MGMFNVALGCLASAMTSNQIVAAMISLVLTIGFFFVTLINYVVNSSSPTSPGNDRLCGSARPYGLLFPWRGRFPGLRFLSEHDPPFAGHHLPGIPVPALESLTISEAAWRIHPPSQPTSIDYVSAPTWCSQTIIVVVIVLLINYLGFNRYRRWDLSGYNKYALSELTKKLLKSLKKEVKIYVFFSPTSQSAGSELYYDLQNLLKEYEFAGKRKVQIETIDPYRNLTRTRELQVKYNFGADENLVILDYQNRKKILRVADMAEYDPPGMFSETPQVRAFRGEQIITSALVELTEEKETRIGFITGHGEPGLEEGSPLTRFKEFVERQNIKLEPLILANLEKIPTDYAAVILAGPKYDLGDRDLSLLRNYWNEQGRILILLDPKVKTPKLNQFLNGFGIRARTGFDRDPI